MPHDMQDLSLWPGIEPVSPALGVQSFNHWTTREVPPSSNVFPYSVHVLKHQGAEINKTESLAFEELPATGRQEKWRRN